MLILYIVNSFELFILLFIKITNTLSLWHYEKSSLEYWDEHGDSEEDEHGDSEEDEHGDSEEDEHEDSEEDEHGDSEEDGEKTTKKNKSWISFVRTIISLDKFNLSIEYVLFNCFQFTRV